MNSQRFNIQCGWLIAASLIMACQLTIVLCLISHFLPYKPDPLLNTIFYHYRTGYMPEREILLYMTGIIIACTCFLVLALRYYHQIINAQLNTAWVPYCFLQGSIVICQIIGAFCITVSQGAWWAWSFFYAFLVMACLGNIFWPEIHLFFNRQTLKINLPSLSFKGMTKFLLASVLALQAILVITKFFFLNIPVMVVLSIVLLAIALRIILIIKPPMIYFYGEVVLTALLCHALMQQMMYPLRPHMAEGAFNFLLFMALLFKFFYHFYVDLGQRIINYFKQIMIHPFAKQGIVAAAILFIFLVIYIPNTQAVIAQFFLGDYFHTWDVVFMGTVYAISQGMTPGVDVNATYGLGITVFLASMAKLLGGFDYANILKTLVILGIVYYAAWYLLLRRIFQYQWLAFAAIILGLRAQVFLKIVAPMVWNEAQASVLRYAVDVFFFWCLWLYLKGHRKIFLWLMVLLAGYSIFYMPTTGVFLAFICFLGIALLLLKEWVATAVLTKEKVFYLIRPLIFIPVVAAGCFYLTVGENIVKADFWARLTEWTSYFSHGFFYQPIFYALQFHEYTKVAIGLLIPVFYLATAFYTGFKFTCAKGKANDGFICLLAVYGLGLFTYYIGMSHKYYSVALPAVFILFFWFDKFLPYFKPVWRPRLIVITVVGCLYCLITTHMFMAYPNLLNWSANPILDPKVSTKVSPRVDYFHQLSVDFPQALKLPVNSLGKVDEDFRFEKDFINQEALISYYNNETAFSEDAALIAQLTKPEERIALLSSFEVMLLSKANRKPFFYYFPLLNSHPMRMRNFVVTTIFSYPQLMRCLKQMEEQQPPYVFMEKIFLTEQVPAWYGQQFEDLITLIRYVRQHYEPYASGKYLVAMKRKEVK